MPSFYSCSLLQNLRRWLQNDLGWLRTDESQQAGNLFTISIKTSKRKLVLRPSYSLGLATECRTIVSIVFRAIEDNCSTLGLYFANGHWALLIAPTLAGLGLTVHFSWCRKARHSPAPCDSTAEILRASRLAMACEMTALGWVVLDVDRYRNLIFGFAHRQIRNWTQFIGFNSSFPTVAKLVGQC